MLCVITRDGAWCAECVPVYFLNSASVVSTFMASKAKYVRR